MNEYQSIINNVPSIIRSTKLEKSISECNLTILQHESVLKKGGVKSMILGEISVGKSTILNALLEKDLFCNTENEGTDSVFICRAGRDNKEKIMLDNRLKKMMLINDISYLKKLNHSNNDVTDFQDKFSLVNVFLNEDNYPILKDKMILTDIPGYDNDYLDVIKEHCKDGNIFTFCFDATCGVTPNDLTKIKSIKNNFGKSIHFIINKCDKWDSLNRDNIINCLRTNFPNLSWNPNIPIYFISALDETERRINDESNREFKRYKTDLINNRTIHFLAYKNVISKVQGSILSIVETMNEMIPRFTNKKSSQSLIDIYCDEINSIPENKFEELDKEIETTIINHSDKCNYYNHRDLLKKLCNAANNTTTQFIKKLFLLQTSISDPVDLATEFYHAFYRIYEIPMVKFSWYEWGDKTDKIKKHLLDYKNLHQKKINEDISEHYKNKVDAFVSAFKTYRNEVNNFATSEDFN